LWPYLLCLLGDCALTVTGTEAAPLGFVWPLLMQAVLVSSHLSMSHYSVFPLSVTFGNLV
jgi:hypothetical protein